MQRFARQATVVLAVAVAAVFAASTVASAGPANDGAASGFGVTINGGGQEIVPPTPEASAAMGEDASETLVDVPAEPVAISGTLTATASVHEQSDIESALTVNSQEAAGPYNASGVGVVENLEVLVNQVDAETSLLSAAVVRAEAVGVCDDEGVASYSANSEIVDLEIAGEDVPLNAPLEQIIDGVNDALEQTTLNQVVNIERNVVTQNPAGGVAVDALVVTLLAAAGDPIAEVRIAHGEVGPLACGPGEGLPRDLPECSDTIDNDGDDLIDYPDDPGCDSPEDDDERDEAVIDTEIPAALPRTGTDGGALAAGALALGSAAFGLTFLRRRLTV